MPAWLDRGERVLLLTPGLEIKSGDRLRTGEGACAYLKLPEGGIVKLGESAQLRHQTAPVPAIFTAALEVATGASQYEVLLSGYANQAEAAAVHIKASLAIDAQPAR